MEIGTLGDGSIIRIKLGFLISVIAFLIGIVSIFVIMRQDVMATLNRLEILEKMQLNDANTINDLRFKVTSIDDNLFYFRKQYEEDQNKYIRESPKNGR